MKKYVTLSALGNGAVDVYENFSEELLHGVKATLEEVEWSEIDNCYYLAGQCPHYSAEELQKQEYEAEIKELQDYLNSTDYIIVKLQEASLLNPEELDTLKAQYAEELEKRQAARSRINELEELLK